MPKGKDVLFTGTKNGVLVRIGEAEDFDRIRESLRQKLEANPQFFQGTSVTIDVGSRVLTTQELLDLEAMFGDRHGVRILQVVNGSERSEDFDDPGTIEFTPPPPTEESTTMPARPRSPAGARELPEGALAGDEHETLLVKRTVRSGRRIRFSGNVVVLGDVNPGAEVIADGDVIVVGSLRGLVHAGATGDDSAIVAAFRLRPTQLRIGQHIARAPDEEQPAPEVPEIARVRDGQVVIDTYQA